jgi:hypothetical protein
MSFVVRAPDHAGYLYEKGDRYYVVKKQTNATRFSWSAACMAALASGGMVVRLTKT